MLLVQELNHQIHKHVDYVTIAEQGNAVDFGDLTDARFSLVFI